MSFSAYNPVELSSYRFPLSINQESSKNNFDEAREIDLITIGSKDIEVNHGSPIDTFIKESPMNYYFNTLKKDQKNEEFSNESESKNKKKEKEIIIPKFPDLSNTKIEDDDFEMNSKDFLDNNRIMRNELLRTNLFQKKLNNDFIKEFYDSFNGDEKVEYIFQPKNEIKKENNNNFLFFESFNENIPKIINYAHISKPTNNDNSTKENVYDQIAKNLKKDLQGNDFYDSENSKKTPEFQKFQTKILPSNQHEELIKVLPKKTSIPSSGVALLNKYNNYDLPMKYDDKYTEVLLNLHNKNSESDINLEDWKFQEPFDENTDENLSKDLRKKLNDHLLLNKENTTKFTRIKKSNLFDHQPILDEMTSFKNTNSSIANQNSDRLKSSPIISIHIHESIQKDLKAKEKKNNQNNEEFKFLEDYRLESVKNKRTLIQNELTNKNSTTIGLSSIENTDNNSEKPMYVLNMEIISSNCLSPIIKENIINLLKSNSNYVINSNESMQDKDREKNPLISDITANKIFTIHENTNNEKKIREPSNERTYKQDCEKIPHMQIPKKNAFSTLCGRKFSLSNIKNMRNDDLFTIKKLNDPFTENKFSNKFSQKNYKDHIYMEMNTPNNRFQRKTKYEQKDLSKSKSKSKINCYYPNEETNFKENKTHFKHHSNPNIIHHIFEDKQIRREKNTSFHTKCDQNIKNHVLTNNLIGNTYLPHVKTKQTMIEYELFKKQKKKQNPNLNILLDKKQLHQVVNKKKTETIIGKSEKINLNKSSIAMMENKENICEEHIDQIKKPNIQKIDHRYFIKSKFPDNYSK